MATQPIPAGYTAITPYLIVNDCDRLIEFMTRAFTAIVNDIHRDEHGRVKHADVSIGGAHVMMGQATGQWHEKLGSILLYVPDADATYKAAIAAGARSIYEPTDHFYGDRSGGVEDPCGVTWWISTHIEDVSPEEMDRRIKAGQAG